MDILSFDDVEAKQIVTDSHVLALPTETVYGLGVRFDSEEAYERLCAVKHRRPDKAIAVMCSLNFELSLFFDIDEKAMRVMKHFLPGPLTCLVKAKDNAPYQCHLGTHVAGIRIPEKPELLEFLSTLPFPLQVTSANMSGEPALKDFNDVYATFANVDEVKGIVKGQCDSGLPTTVVDLTKDRPVLIRQGKIRLEEIEAVYYGE